VTSLVNRYNEELDALKGIFEKATKSLQEGYIKEAKEAFLK
jgi:soluble cytochrome b562